MKIALICARVNIGAEIFSYMHLNLGYTSTEKASEKVAELNSAFKKLSHLSTKNRRSKEFFAESEVEKLVASHDEFEAYSVEIDEIK